MSEFIRPQVDAEDIRENVTRFTVEPLERGYGDTLGNSLRRVLLSSLEGAAVEAIMIDGVQHEFTTVEGVYEDVTAIVLNVKELVFKSMGTGEEAVASVNVDGPCTVTAGDFDVPAEFELINPEHVVCTLGEGHHLSMKMRIGTGRGYVSNEDNTRSEDPIGIIHVDSRFSPVRRCAKAVEPCRVGQHTDYDRLVLEVETDGFNPQHNEVLRAFAAHILNGEPLVASGVEGIRGLTLANAMYLSSWTGETIELPLDEDRFLEELNKRRATSRRKEDVSITLDTEGTYGNK